MTAPVTVGVSLKAYFGSRQATEWLTAVAPRVTTHPAVVSGAVQLFLIPTFVQIPTAVALFDGTPVIVGAQDVSVYPAGAYTGEVTAADLAEAGVGVTEIGHAERRRLFGETDEVTARKAAASLNQGLTPVLCLGEDERLSPTDAANAVCKQLAANLASTPAGAVIVAYEPVWAIGAPAPAPAEHIRVVCAALRQALDADLLRAGSAVIYGGSAGPGLLGQLDGTADGLFLGRFAHDPDNLIAVLDDAHALAHDRSTA